MKHFGKEIGYGLEQTMRRSKVNSNGRQMVTQYRSPIGHRVSLMDAETKIVRFYGLTQNGATIHAATIIISSVKCE